MSFGYSAQHIRHKARMEFDETKCIDPDPLRLFRKNRPKVENFKASSATAVKLRILNKFSDQDAANAKASESYGSSHT